MMSITDHWRHSLYYLVKHPDVGRGRGKGKKENGSYVGTLHPQQYRSILVDPSMNKNSWRIHQFKLTGDNTGKIQRKKQLFELNMQSPDLDKHTSLGTY